MRSDGQQEEIQRQDADPGLVRMPSDRLRRHQVAAASEAFVALYEGAEAGSAVVRRRGDLKGERICRMVEYEIDLLVAVPPMVQSNP